MCVSALEHQDRVEVMLNRQMSAMSMQRVVALYVEGYHQGLEDIKIIFAGVIFGQISIQLVSLRIPHSKSRIITHILFSLLRF